MEPTIENLDTTHAVRHTCGIVSAYVGHNSVPANDLPGLIRTIHDQMRSLGSPGVAAPSAAPNLTPAVPIKKSVMADHIVCLEDGKKFRSMKRHLGTAYNMTPEQYREKWGLPSDYPMVAPNYSSIRSTLAKTAGLGQKRGGEPKAAKAPSTSPKKGRGRPKKAA